MSIQNTVDEGIMTLPTLATQDDPSPLTVAAPARQSIAMTLQASGAEWDAEAYLVTRTGLRIFVDGYPYVLVDQPIRFEFSSARGRHETSGIVKAIKPRGHNMKDKWAQIELSIAFDALDDLKWHVWKGLQDSASSTSTTPALRGTLMPMDSCESLWLVKPLATHAPEQRTAPDGVHTPDANAFTSPEQDAAPAVTSTFLEFPGTRGAYIRAYHDVAHARISPTSPVAIVSPGYGETKREYITLAYYLASNGFHVLRYDHTHHLGESDGDHLRTTLTTMDEDLRTVLQYARQRWPHSRTALLATSLSARVAIKAAATGADMDLLMLMTPIVDVRHTLKAVHQEDLIGQHMSGTKKGVTNVLGFNVELDQWLKDATGSAYASLETTRADAESLRAPVVMVSAEHDTWVNSDGLIPVAESLGEQLKQWLVVPDGLHRILENPRRARAVYRELIRSAHQLLNTGDSIGNLVDPTRKAIGQQNKIERERKKLQEADLPLSEFWKDYLDHFHYIINFADYQQLLQHALRALGPVEADDTILDAGCGNGNIGSLLVRNARAAHALGTQTKSTAFTYVGLDFVPTALREAQSAFQSALRECRTSIPWRKRAVSPSSSFHCADLNQPLPFKSGTFSKVVSNLVLGYLDDPTETIREMLRVLDANGTLVFTNLKPNSDLSQIYTNFVQETTDDTEVTEAKQLLNNAGKIRAAEAEGIFRFPDADELLELIARVAPDSSAEVYTTFANQAYLVVVKKQASHTLHSPTQNLESWKAA